MNKIFSQIGIWIHKNYPYIQKVHINFNQNEFEIVSALNQAISNPNLQLLQQEICNIEQLLNMAKSKHAQYTRVLETQMGTSTVNFLLSCHIRNCLKNQLDYLQNLGLELDGPQEITLLDLRQYQIKYGARPIEENKIEIAQNTPFIGPVFENKWDETFPSFIIPDKKMDPYEVVPSPLKMQNLFLEGDLCQFQTLNCGGWIIGNENFQSKNQFPTESKIKLKADLENDGQAGLFELRCLDTAKTFIGQDENVLKAIQAILYFVFPEYKQYDDIPFPEKSKYKNNSAVMRMKNYAENEADEGYNALEYIITINTSSEFKNEATRKKILDQIKKVIDKENLW